ncbi:uncharacterized protein LOC108117699 [Drosophila eugracilis]|uniref:uncharacterized protein LOC108117699 n=1 Tax=Drosophila eugracilis TaxID=29029 RepID=UPI0007E5F943|nr:uncharacterized protein LOC108117699 [Drosophila eugracilis]
MADLARLFKEKLLMDASVPPSVAKDIVFAQPQSNGNRRGRSKTRQGKEPPTSSGESEVRRRDKSRHCDPVALFQYYQKEWAHFRSQIPGEKNHVNARFGDRRKPIDSKK